MLFDATTVEKPFRHHIIDNFYHELIPFPGKLSNVHSPHEHCKGKSYESEIWKFPVPTGELVQRLMGPLALMHLERLTRVVGLIPDPYLYGAGLHRTERGGFLDLHTDFNWHPKLNLQRRVNLLIFASDWTPGDGGELELYAGGERTVIQPLQNRCVIFEADKCHGHPNKLYRKSRDSIAVYYYTATHVKEEDRHGTVYLGETK